MCLIRQIEPKFRQGLGMTCAFRARCDVLLNSPGCQPKQHMLEPWPTSPSVLPDVLSPSHTVPGEHRVWQLVHLEVQVWLFRGRRPWYLELMHHMKQGCPMMSCCR